MGNALIPLLLLVTLNPSSTARTIERAFLQNNARALLELLPTEGRINLSFPEPISFSDQLSDQQTFLLLKKLFTTYTTQEFFSELREEPQGEKSYFFKARWSFQDKNKNLYALDLFFQLGLITDEEGACPDWKITDIRAEKI
ncbi:MAG: hypothetical protein WBB73_12610 [Candidatus Aminicenantaceae bacterium]